MTSSIALRAALGIALLTAMDAVIKGQMQQHPFIVALFMRFAMGGLCALAVLAIARPARPTRASLIGNIARVLARGEGFKVGAREVFQAGEQRLGAFAPARGAQVGFVNAAMPVAFEKVGESEAEGVVGRQGFPLLQRHAIAAPSFGEPGARQRIGERGASDGDQFVALTCSDARFATGE